MPPSRYTRTEILAFLREYLTGTAATELCERLGIHLQTLYRWKKIHGDAVRDQLVAQAAQPDQIRPVAAFANHRVAPASNHHALRLPDTFTLEYCQELIAFLSATGSEYRVVLDAEGVSIEPA